MFSDMKTKPACPALTDTAALLAFFGHFRRLKSVPAVLCRLTLLCLQRNSLCRKALLAPKAAATAPSRGESPRELPDALGVVTLTSPPVALSSPLETVPKALETEQQRRKKQRFRPWE